MVHDGVLYATLLRHLAGQGVDDAVVRKLCSELEPLKQVDHPDWQAGFAWQSKKRSFCGCRSGHYFQFLAMGSLLLGVSIVCFTFEILAQEWHAQMEVAIVGTSTLVAAAFALTTAWIAALRGRGYWARLLLCTWLLFYLLLMAGWLAHVAMEERICASVNVFLIFLLVAVAWLTRPEMQRPVMPIFKEEEISGNIQDASSLPCSSVKSSWAGNSVGEHDPSSFDNLVPSADSSFVRQPSNSTPSSMAAGSSLVRHIAESEPWAILTREKVSQPHCHWRDTSPATHQLLIHPKSPSPTRNRHESHGCSLAGLDERDSESKSDSTGSAASAASSPEPGLNTWIDNSEPLPPPAPAPSRGVSFIGCPNHLNEERIISRINSRRGTGFIEAPETMLGQRVSFSTEIRMIDRQLIVPLNVDNKEEDGASEPEIEEETDYCSRVPRISVVCNTRAPGSPENSSSGDSDDTEEDHYNPNSISDSDKDSDKDIVADAARALHKATRNTARAARRALRKVATRVRHESESDSSGSESCLTPLSLTPQESETHTEEKDDDEEKQLKSIKTRRKSGFVPQLSEKKKEKTKDKKKRKEDRKAKNNPPEAPQLLSPDTLREVMSINLQSKNTALYAPIDAARAAELHGFFGLPKPPESLMNFGFFSPMHADHPAELHNLVGLPAPPPPPEPLEPRGPKQPRMIEIMLPLDVNAVAAKLKEGSESPLSSASAASARLTPVGVKGRRQQALSPTRTTPSSSSRPLSALHEGKKEKYTLHRDKESALLTATLYESPGMLLKDLVNNNTNFAAMSLQDLIKRIVAEGLAGFDVAPSQPVADSMVRRDSLTDMGINLNSAFVQEMLTALNGGVPPQKCTCKPGQPHSCMTPAASAFVSLAATVSHTIAHTVAQTTTGSRRNSGTKLDSTNLDKSNDDSSDSSTDSDDATVVSAAEGGRRNSNVAMRMSAFLKTATGKGKRVSFDKSDFSDGKESDPFIPDHVNNTSQDEGPDNDGEDSVDVEQDRGLFKRQNSTVPKQTSHAELAQHEEDADLEYSTFGRVNPEDLDIMIANKTAQIIDVRGRDFKGGHIPGCRNMATTSIIENPGIVADICRTSSNVRQLVFTCMYSKLRAPRCANAVARQLQRPEEEEESSVAVLVLDGGMHGWINYWRTKSSVAEFQRHVSEFDSTMWQDCADAGRAEGQLFSNGLVHIMDVVWSEGGQRELALALEDALHNMLHDNLRRVSVERNDPDLQDFAAVQKVDARLLSSKLRRNSSINCESQYSGSSRKSSLLSKSSRRGSREGEISSSPLALAELVELRNTMLHCYSPHLSVGKAESIPEDEVFEEDLIITAEDMDPYG